MGGPRPHPRPPRPLHPVRRQVLLGDAGGLRGQVVAEDDGVRGGLQLPEEGKVLLNQVVTKRADFRSSL